MEIRFLPFKAAGESEKKTRRKKTVGSETFLEMHYAF